MAKFTPIDRKAFGAGAKRGAKLGPHAVSAHFDKKHHRVVMHLDTGIDVSFDPRQAYGLERANADDLAGVEIAGAGGALHFPNMDAFFSIPRLLEGFFGPMDWTRRLARAEASRRNGRLGGRPPKKVPAEAA